MSTESRQDQGQQLERNYQPLLKRKRPRRLPKWPNWVFPGLSGALLVVLIHQLQFDSGLFAADTHFSSPGFYGISSLNTNESSLTTGISSPNLTTHHTNPSTTSISSPTTSSGSTNSSGSSQINPQSSPPATIIPNWLSTQVYDYGDRVMYKGKIYEAKRWTLNDIPDLSILNGPWKEIIQ